MHIEIHCVITDLFSGRVMQSFGCVCVCVCVCVRVCVRVCVSPDDKFQAK